MHDSLPENTIFTKVWRALGGSQSSMTKLSFSAEGDLPSVYPVTELASASVASAALSISELLGQAGLPIPDVTVDRRLASFWFGWSLRPLGWKMPAAWDPIAGDYQTNDGWIRLHTNAPHHRAAAERVLGKQQEKAGMARAVVSWAKSDLEAAVIEAGGCAAEMRSVDEWAIHPQGQAVAAEPPVQFGSAHLVQPSAWMPLADRPLSGLRVLDMTRVLAGPVASRFLAGYGADVLRIDPPSWDEPGVIPEVTLGKRCARLDLRDPKGRRTFEELLSRADILLLGYRSGALDRLGFDIKARRAISPALIEVALNAYGWTGPWSGRRGFDSLVQMSSGIAHEGMTWKASSMPSPLPVQALDHATGYLVAAAAIRLITRSLGTGERSTARLSLARTAKLLTDAIPQEQSNLAVEDSGDLLPTIEHTAWGEAQRLRPPASVAGAPMQWAYPANELGSSSAVW